MTKRFAICTQEWEGWLGWDSCSVEYFVMINLNLLQLCSLSLFLPLTSSEVEPWLWKDVLEAKLW